MILQKKFGENFICPDEHYFINVMKKYNISFTNRLITYVNWSENSDLKKYRVKPKTYSILLTNKIQNVS